MSPRPTGLSALAGFFWFGALMSSLSAISLCYPDSGLNAIWRLNPAGHVGLLRAGRWGVLLMLTISAVCGMAGIGVWRLAPWGRWAAVGVLGVNLLADLANALLRGDLRTLIGLPVGGALIFYLFTPRVSAAFHRASPDAGPQPT